MKSFRLFVALALIFLSFLAFHVEAKNRTSLETIETRMLSDLSVSRNVVDVGVCL